MQKLMLIGFLKNVNVAIEDNVLRLGGRFNAAKTLLYAGTVDLVIT